MDTRLYSWMPSNFIEESVDDTDSSFEDFEVDITEEELFDMVEEAIKVAKTKGQLIKKKRDAKINKQEKARAAGTTVAQLEKKQRLKSKKYRKKNRVKLAKAAKKFALSVEGKRSKKIQALRDIG